MTLPLKPDAQRRGELVSNILKAWDAASPDQRARGRAWYRTAHDLAVIVGGSATVGAGLLAVLSAQRQWLETIRMAQAASDTWNADLSTTQLRTVRNQRVKVDRILAGEDPATVLPMDRKTGQFYLSIVNPDDATAVTVDRHAHDVAMGRPYGDEPRGLSSVTRYGLFADAYRTAALRLGELPSTVQAVTWVYWTEMLDETLGPAHRGWAR